MDPFPRDLRLLVAQILGRAVFQYKILESNRNEFLRNVAIKNSAFLKNEIQKMEREMRRCGTFRYLKNMIDTKIGHENFETNLIESTARNRILKKVWQEKLDESDFLEYNQMADMEAALEEAAKDDFVGSTLHHILGFKVGCFGNFGSTILVFGFR